MACGTLNPRYWPAVAAERHGDAEDAEEDVDDALDDTSLFPPLVIAAPAEPIAPPDSGVGAIDVDVLAAAEAPPEGEILAVAGFGADELVVPSPAGGGGDGAVPPPAA